MYEHGPGNVADWIAEAYEDSAHRLQEDFELAFGRARGWRDGVRWATEELVATLATDPARARFGYVEVMRAGVELRERRERVRQRSIDLFLREYVARHGAARMSQGKIELACNTIIHAIASHAAADKMGELPGAMDAMLLVAGACEL